MPVRIVPKQIVILSPEHAPRARYAPLPRKFSEGRIQRSILAILQNNVLGSMSTVNRKQRAYINTAYICSSDTLEFYFLSDPNSIHCRNLQTNSSMAMTIFDSRQKWGMPDRGLQLFGTCRAASSRQAIQAEQLYSERFAAFRTTWTKRTRFRYRFYRFVPTQLKLLDERQFGAGVFIIADLKRR